MSRMVRVVNYTCTTKNTWYTVFDENDYKNNRIREVKVKPREDTTADHFRYNFDGSTTIYLTSTSGFSLPKDVKKLYVYIPSVDSQIIEIEVLYF